MATSSTSDDTADKNYADRQIPNPSDVLGLMVSVQRFHQQLLWQMGEVMADMISMPLDRDRKDKKRGAVSRVVTDLTDAVDGATDVLQRSDTGKTR